MRHTYDFARPAVTVDVAVFRGEAAARQVLLVRRAAPPFEYEWALPGGFIEEGETLESAARRELVEETGLDLQRDLVQLGAYGDPGRDPRGWTVTVAFIAVLEGSDPFEVAGSDDAAEASWSTVTDLPPLAFDHAKIVADALRIVGSST